MIFRLNLIAKAALKIKVQLHFVVTWPNLVGVQTRLESATLASFDVLVFVAFHSFKNSSLKFPVAYGAAFSDPEQDNLASSTKII